MERLTGAQLLVKCLETHGVEYIFGIPGAKIDRVFDALLDSSIKLIVCRHEQNAAFMAGAYGRLTGKPGVVLVTSGPGVSNLSTGLLTATTEGDPIVAIGGNVPREMCLKKSHQSTNNVKLLEAVTKFCVEIPVIESITEIVANAFRIAMMPQSGACFISFPQDLQSQMTDMSPIKPPPLVRYGSSPNDQVQRTIQLINQAKYPVLMLGMEASRPENTAAIRQLLREKHFPVVSNYQAAGVISQDLLSCFIGRVGLFKNQPGDIVLAAADLVVTIGFNTVEYDPEIWNAENKQMIIHINYTPADINNAYDCAIELVGDIASNIRALQVGLDSRKNIEHSQLIQESQKQLTDKINSGKSFNQSPIHPLRFIHELHQVVNDDTIICCDIGSVYMWMARYYFTYEPHRLLFSNGQQTLGVGLPWAIAANFARPGNLIISMSGDGGFLFSAMELETAVREKLKIIHFIWRDGTYNMVLEQEMMKYHRKSGVDFGKLSIPDFAKSFGALGFELTHPDDFKSVFIKAMRSEKPVLIDVPIDYSHNIELFESVDPKSGY